MATAWEHFNKPSVPQRPSPRLTEASKPCNTVIALQRIHHKAADECPCLVYLVNKPNARLLYLVKKQTPRLVYSLKNCFRTGLTFVFGVFAYTTPFTKQLKSTVWFIY